MSASMPGNREIARGLVAALRPALNADAAAATKQAARDVAQVLVLPGLEAAIKVLERFAGPTRPFDASLLAARLERLAAAVEREDDWRLLRAADTELADLAARLMDTEWSGGAGHEASTPAEPTHAVLDVLSDLPLHAGAAMDSARLNGAVAASLRAAVDWAGFDLAPLVHAVVHDSALTLTAPCGHEAGLGPAAAVLAAIEGSLAREADGRWTMRVPLFAECSSYLLMRQGRIGFALPWHSVARLRILSRGAEHELAEPVIDAFTTGPESEGERPAALVALGLARAWVIADRIVWRIAAQPVESEVAGPFGSPPMVVMLDQQERYWVADAAWLLRNVATPEVALPEARLRTAPVLVQSVAVAPETSPAETAPLETQLESSGKDSPDPFLTGQGLADAVAHAIDSLRAERPAFVAAIGTAAPAAVSESQGTAVSPPRSAPLYHVHTTVHSPVHSPEPAANIEVSASTSEPAARNPARNPLRRALVADDSLVARIFLARMLERRGYFVETVADGASLWSELQSGPWSLVCADFAMPDSHGLPHIERLLDFRANCSEPFTLVVLTRDDAEDLLSRNAGAALLLRKPFERDDLDQLIGKHA